MKIRTIKLKPFQMAALQKGLEVIIESGQIHKESGQWLLDALANAHDIKLETLTENPAKWPSDVITTKEG